MVCPERENDARDAGAVWFEDMLAESIIGQADGEGTGELGGKEDSANKKTRMPTYRTAS